MDEDLYDEFGNYIGPQISSQSDNERQVQKNIAEEVQDVHVVHVSNQHKIILHQDKKYYQAHQQMYPQAQIMIEQQDRQNLDTPIVAKIKQRNYDLREALTTTYPLQYMLDLMQNPAVIRNVTIAGHLHHGKTLIMDMLIQQTHIRNWDLQKNYRWLDNRLDQQQRQLTIKSTPISLLLPDLKGKHYVINFIDTPGHPNFSGQITSSLRLTDGIVLVVDVIEGVMMTTQKIIRYAIRQNLKVIVFINKIDRLIIQLKIPPQDAYLKIKHTLQEINGLFQKISAQLGKNNQYLIAPSLGNVVFGSGQYSFMFSLQSMANKYKQLYPSIDTQTFQKILWGDYYFNPQTKKFSKKPSQNYHNRTFITFILQPIYKIFAHTVGKDKNNLQQFLKQNLKIVLTTQQYKLNIKTMIKLIFHKYFLINSCIVSSIISHINPPNKQIKNLINNNYKNNLNTQFIKQIIKGQNLGPLYINTTKLYHKDDYKSFDVLGRVISGTIRINQSIKIMGQNYQIGQQQDIFVRNVNKLYILQGRYKIQVQYVSAGNLVLIQGIDQSVTKTATIVSTDSKFNDADIMLPLKFWTEPVVKIAIEPLIPSQLPKMMEAIRKVNKSYPLLKSKVQQSGEHVLLGTGQLFLDCILFDIRNLYSDIQVRISNPCVCFAQTVAQTSGIPCYADTPNKKNRIKILAGPLEKGIAQTVEKELVNVDNQQELKNLLESKYDWDILASSNVWSFGPEKYSSNILINDSLPTPTDQNLLQRHKNTIIQGFQWSTREGPLCDQPMRNVKFRIIQAELSKNPIDCPPGQLIPTARRAFYSAFLTATPRIMEPMFLTQIQCTTQQSIDAVFTVLAKRRGSVQSEIPKPGTPHYIIKAFIPCIQTLGFETDLRVHTVGQAFCLSTFDHWQVLPGDPLDKKIVLKPLQVLQPHELARQFMIKTRRRKGLNQEVSIVKYFDDLNIKDILKNDISFKQFI